MSETRIIGEFCKSGSWHAYSRRFHNLTRDAKLKAISLIQSGVDVSKALRQAKRSAQ